MQDNIDTQEACLMSKLDNREYIVDGILLPRDSSISSTIPLKTPSTSSKGPHFISSTNDLAVIGSRNTASVHRFEVVLTDSLNQAICKAEEVGSACVHSSQRYLHDISVFIGPDCSRIEHGFYDIDFGAIGELAGADPHE